MLRPSRPKARLVLLVLLALLVIGGGLLWQSLQPGFEPGGGGADELPQRREADGTVVLRVRLNVWGGGGAIDGRYRDVMLVAAPVDPFATATVDTSASASLRVSGQIAPGGDAATQW